MSNIKLRPIGNGYHNNVHFIANDKDKMISFKIVAFTESGDAYIVKNSCKISSNYLNPEEIHKYIADKLSQAWGFNLKTKVEDLFVNFNDTTDVIVKYNVDYNNTLNQ